MVLSYMHNVGLNDFMMKVFLGMKEVVYVCLVNGKVHVNACSLLVGYLLCVRFWDFTCTLN